MPVRERVLSAAGEQRKWSGPAMCWTHRRLFVQSDCWVGALQLEEEYLASCRSKVVKRPLGFDLPEAAPSTNNKLLENIKKSKRR